MSSERRPEMQLPSLLQEDVEVAVRPVEVGPDENAVVVHTEEHQWISVTRDGVELVRESAGEPSTQFVLAPGEYELRTDGRFRSVETAQRDVVEPAALFRMAEAVMSLGLDVEAPSRHPVDGMPQVPADGTSSCTITVRKYDAAGETAKGRKHAEDVYLRSTGGSLMAADGESRVASARLKSGTLTFRLVSDNAPKVVTVYAFTETSTAEVRVEFI
jgi:hypothetical protein